MSHSTEYNWNGYQFPVEEYINQLHDNPYIYELIDDLTDQKYKKLSKFLKKEILVLLDIDIIDKIYTICNTDDKLENFTDILNKRHLDIINPNNNLNQLKIIEKIIKDFNPLTLNKINDLEPTKLRISTMTVCSSVGCEINTIHLYNSFKEQVNYLNPDTYNDKKKKYLPEARGIIGCKAESFKVKGRFEKEKKFNFFNSAALNVLVKDNKCINVKVFNNGKIQMTGVPDEQTGRECVQKYLIDYFNNIPDNNETLEKITIDKNKLVLTDFKIVLINSDFFCGVEIQRENLYRILIDRYNLSVSYESENYPGVKLEYFWNINNIDSEKEGQCVCLPKCKGKGNGIDKMNDCKKITISTFQSGKVIITGARSIKQINNAYDYINKIFNINYDYISKKTIKNKQKIKFNNHQIQSSKFFFLKKNNIKNYEQYKILLN